MYVWRENKRRNGHSEVKMKNGKLAAASLFLCGLAAGILNGLIGVGGGVLIIYFLTYLNDKIHPSSLSPERPDMFAAAVASVLPMTAVSVAALLWGGYDIPTDCEIKVSDFIPPAAVGGVIGALLLDKISTVWLGRIFSALTIWAGVSMILREAGLL